MARSPRYYDDDPYRPGSGLYDGHDVHQHGVSPYYDVQLIQDRDSAGGKGQPRWCRPGGCFRDQLRCYRLRGSLQVDDPANGLFYDDQILSRPWKVAAREQLEVCRTCGAYLKLDRDDEGVVVRRFETQPQYCSERCRRDADNRRDRQRRRGGKFPRDEYGRYIQRAAPAVRRDPETRATHVPGVHRYDTYEASVTHTVSGDYRLRPPWARRPAAWQIARVA